jgi:putative ABC transport system ATP-binding protein
MPARDSLVRLHDVHYGYREGSQYRPVLCGLEGAVQRGEYVALLGQSGSGKSTLLNLLAGLDLPETGEIVIGGETINRLSETRRTLFRRRHIGFIFQFFNLIPTLTVAENVMLPLELTAAPAAQRDRAWHLLDEIGLADRSASYPDQLSGGEQQRVAIVRSLALDPALILADEPTGNLDLETGERMLDVFDRLIRAQGKTLLVVTHSAEVARRADRIVHLVEGRWSTA